MSETPHDPPPTGGTVLTRNKGQQLVHGYRLARIAARPALRTELRECRTELQQQRVSRTGQGGAQAAPPRQAPGRPVSDARGPAAELVPGGEAAASIFATYCVAMVAPARADAAPDGAEPPPPDIPPTSARDATPECEAAPECEATPESEGAPESEATPETEPSPKSETTPEPDAMPEPDATPEPRAMPAPLAKPEQTPVATPIVARVVPLSAIGFGPGMTIRMRQLGIETAGDLAAADATWLQTALGDLSDLIHAESWIASARQACDQAA